MQKVARGAAIPEKVGRYEILLPIASGGMATVYLARARGAGGFQRDVALKLTHAHLKETTEFTSDLLDEANLAVRIKHPNVVPVLDVDDDPLGLFLVMEYVEGDTLGGLRRRGNAQSMPLPRGVGIRVLLDALAGLHAAHELKNDDGSPLDLVHRDFSPQNILVGVDGIAKLTDFGIAKASSRLSETRAGLVKGKISYMAPEQARSHTLDRRCDVWAAGIIAWEILAERRLYASDNDVGTLLKVVSEQPPLLRTVAPDLSIEVEQAVKHALTMDLKHRVPSALAFHRELAAACAASGLLAPHEEVGSYLATLVGQRLADRRTRAAEIVRLRSKIDRVVEQSSSDAQAKRLDQAVSAARGSLNQIPEPDSSSSDVVVASFRESAKTLVALPALAAHEAAPPYLLSNAVASGPSGSTAIASSEWEASPVASTDSHERAPELSSDDLSDADVVAHGVPSRRDSKRVALLAGGVLLMLGGITVVAFGRGKEGYSMRAVAAPSTVVAPVDSSAAAVGRGATSTAFGSVDLAVPVPHVEGAAAERSTLVVHANAPVSFLHLDDRVATPSKAARDVEVELTGSEHARTLKLLAASTDGRESMTLVPAGATSIAIEFKTREVAEPAVPASKPHPVKSAPLPQKPPTLAPSPYAAKP